MNNEHMVHHIGASYASSAIMWLRQPWVALAVLLYESSLHRACLIGACAGGAAFLLGQLSTLWSGLPQPKQVKGTLPVVVDATAFHVPALKAGQW